MKIKSIIVEDEYSAREALKAYIQKYCPQIELLGEAADAKQAIELIHQKRPQLVFLDVELPFGNAFDILESCKGVPFETIFITAYSEYSLRALNLSAAYYILKPVNIEELIVAVNKVQEILEKQQIYDRNLIVIENFKSEDFETKSVLLPTMEGFELIKMKNIVRLQGNGNFTDIYLIDGSKKMACRFLKHYEEILPHPFLRIHKSHIINLHYVTSYIKSDGGYVVLQDKSEILISQSYKDQFLEKFKML